jgi:hypothetical protein
MGQDHQAFSFEALAKSYSVKNEMRVGNPSHFSMSFSNSRDSIFFILLAAYRCQFQVQSSLVSLSSSAPSRGRQANRQAGSQMGAQ